MDKAAFKEQLYAKIDELPTIPVVVTRLLSLLENPDVSVSELTRVISSDQALSFKVLKTANSAYYGFAQEVASLDRAVALLGLNMVKSLSLSIGVLRALPKVKDRENISAQGLWQHSLAVATLAQQLSAGAGRSVQEDHLFVTGLLHDVGKIVLLHFFTDLYVEILEGLQSDASGTLAKAERSQIGFDHGEIGALLLQRWKFPLRVIQPIAAHHHEGELPAKFNRKVVACLRIADTLAKELQIGWAGNPYGILPADLDELGLSSAGLDRLRQELQGSAEKLQSFFEAMNMA